MKKVCIISLMNIKHSSLISMYTSFLEENEINYDIIYADKYNIQEKINSENTYKYILNFKNDEKFLVKLKEYLRFAQFSKRILKNNDYDLIIVWRTETAFLLVNYLLFSNKKFILNIRDYCHERNLLIKLLLKKTVEKSLFTTISSKGFYKFLPKSKKYLFINSLNESILPSSIQENGSNQNYPINISFIGYIRFIEQDIKLIKALGNDDRFVMSFIGAGSEKLYDYITINNIKNVNLIEGFPVEQTLSYLNKADIINNLYGSDNIALDTAISTRYYHSIILNKPILVNNGTYMSELIEENQGYIVDSYEDLANKLFDWYKKIDFQKLYLENQSKLNVIKDENKILTEKLNAIFKVGE